MELKALAESIDALVACDPSVHADAQSVEFLHRQLARLEAVIARATAAFDSSGDFALDGARNTASWLAARCGLPKRQARREVALGRKLRHLPVFALAWSEGEITSHHVAAVPATRKESTVEALRRDEELLVDHARQLRFEHYTWAITYWAQLADPDGAEEDAQAQHALRDAYLEASFGGMWFGKVTLDPISGAIVGGELCRLEAELFEHDWSEARARLGREPTVEDLHRTPGQRCADALVEMATRSGSASADGRRPAPLFSVFVGYETLHGRICELAHGAVVSPGSLLPWLDEAVIERAVFASPRRVEVSTTARLFTGATRRAIELRDRECSHPFCDRPASGVRGRSHRPLQGRRPDHAGERAYGLRVPQPPAKRSAATCGVARAVSPGGGSTMPS